MSSSGASAGGSLRIVTGPTAAGKSALAMELAERHGALIVSADSRQIYRRFDIGTAKPTPEEQARVMHRGVDVVEPTERYSASRFGEDAEVWIAEALALGRAPLVVGGTGFYIRALVAPLFEQPPLDPERRRALEGVLAELPTGELRRWCETLDPARAHLGRAQLLRAAEVALLTGERLSELQRARARPPRFRARYLVVDPGLRLQRRIADRARDMLDAGWPEEVRRLAERVPPDAPAWNSTGYETVRELAEGRITRERAVERIVIETRQYAKRQRTWLRHQLPEGDVTRLDPGAPDRDAVVEAWWHGEEDA